MSKKPMRVVEWRYNGVAPWEEIYLWCRDNLKHCWNNGYNTFYFDDKREYAWFLLKWS